VKVSIDEVWSRLLHCEGEPFQTKTGKSFQYEIRGEIFRPNRTRYNVPKGDFRKALELVPFDGPGHINDSVRGPAYVWAVLHDKRIRKTDW
jgi:hypothetical protein